MIKNEVRYVTTEEYDNLLYDLDIIEENDLDYMGDDRKNRIRRIVLGDQERDIVESLRIIYEKLDLDFDYLVTVEHLVGDKIIGINYDYVNDILGDISDMDRSEIDMIYLFIEDEKKMDPKFLRCIKNSMEYLENEIIYCVGEGEVPISFDMFIRKEDNRYKNFKTKKSKNKSWNNGARPKGGIANKIYYNETKILPPGKYKEYDINNRIKGQKRDKYRFVRNEVTEEVYYTDNHYARFWKIEE